MISSFPSRFSACIIENKSLSRLSTFGIGGSAKYYIEAHSVEEMQEFLAFCHSTSLPNFILGKGSNCLFDDRGFDGLVIGNRIEFCNILSSGEFHVGAGYSFSLLGTQTARQNWKGLEFASGIPASVGGAVFMNAGANGSETCDHLVSIDYVMSNGSLHHLPRAELQFAYRHSPFQSMSGAIVGATFKLQPCDQARKKQIEIITYRKQTQPITEKSAGCVFRNPDGGKAGAWIDQLNLKGSSVGGAKVSEKHANFIINNHDASSKDVRALIEHIQTEVYNAKGIHLESEIRIIPYQKEQLS